MNQPPPGPTIPVPPKNSGNSGLAIWSLVLGILSLTCFSIFSAVPAVICGHVARARINRSGGALEGGGLALGGIITGYISIGLSILMIPMLLAIAVPNFVKARNVAQMNACINNLRQIDGAKQTWALDLKKESTDTPTSADLQPYLKKGFEGLTCPAGGVYKINSVGEKPTCSIANHELPN